MEGGFALLIASLSTLFIHNQSEWRTTGAATKGSPLRRSKNTL